MSNPYELGRVVDADKAWIQTFSGGKFHLLAPRQDEIHIVDIAHALSNICRFTGHVREFYSVAEHSIHASYLVPAEDAFWALLHDASEAYCADLNRPLKHYTAIGPVYKEVEERVMDAICDRFGLSHVEPKSVYDADGLMLYAEKEQLMPRMEWDTRWQVPVAANVVLKCWSPKIGKQKFLKRFNELHKVILQGEMK